MSTILKALKQAEKDNPDQGGGNRLSFNARSALRSRMQQQKQNSFLSLGRVVIFVALVIGMAIFSYPLFFIDKNIHPQTPYSGNRSPVVDKLPGIVKDQKQTFVESIAKPSDLHEASSEMLPKSAIESFHLTEPADAPETIPDDNASLIVEESPLSHLEIKDPIKDEDELLNKDTPKQEIILPLKNDSLKIQAISWAEEPAKRIAVIDNRVLREGDYVQGYRLVIIETDSVILHYSGSDYRMEFKY